MKRPKLPARCECGGRMLYAFDFGRVFSCCATCTPVATVRLPVQQAGTPEGTKT